MSPGIIVGLSGIVESVEVSTEQADIETMEEITRRYEVLNSRIEEQDQ